MKRILRSTILTSFVSAFSFSQCEDFFDGFETGSYSPTWTNTGGSLTATVLNSPVAVGNYALSTSGGSSHLTGLMANFPAITPPEISWYIYPNGTVANNYMVAGDATTAAANCIMFIYWQGTTGNIRFVSSVSLDYPAIQNQWYHIEMKNIDYVNRVFDIYVDGALIYTAFPFRSTTINTMTVMHLYNFAGGTAYYDHILAGNTPISFDLVGTDLLCNGDMNGAIDATVYDAQGPVNFSWSNSATTEDISGLSGGTYTLTATDSAGCVAIDSLVISEPLAIWATYDSLNPTTCAGMDGSIDLYVDGGVPGYSYSWSSGDTTASIGGLPAGIYDVTVTDTNGCNALWSVTLSDPEPPLVSISWATQNTCTYYLPFSLSGGIPTGGAWTGTGVVGNTFDPGATALGSNILTYTYTDSLNCSASSTAEVYVDQCLGLEETNDLECLVFPNPARTLVNIRIKEGSYTVCLTSIFGQEAARGQFVGSAYQMPTEGLAPGMYHLEISSETQRLIQRLVIE